MTRRAGSSRSSEKIGGELLHAYEAALTLFQPVESLSGSLDEFGNSALLEIRGELEYTTRRLRNLALAHGGSPAAVEKISKMGKMRPGTTRTDPRGRCGNAGVPTHPAG